jgi:uncharacterized glyoxalase superfamily protein PhnB
MGLSIDAVTFDCANAKEIAEFWSAALERPVDTNDEPSEFFASIGRDNPTPGQPVLMFIQVPEGKTAKNRTHLDLNASDRAAEVERLVGLGATVIHDQDEWGVRWTTLSDPAGNEFCVAEH